MGVRKIIKMSTSWCRPCIDFSKTFNDVKALEEYKDIEFKEINIEEDEDGELLAEKYGVRSVPSTIFLGENDEFMCKISGNVSRAQFTDIIDTKIKE